MHFPERVDPRLARRGPQDVAAARLRKKTDTHIFLFGRVQSAPHGSCPRASSADLFFMILPGRVEEPRTYNAGATLALRDLRVSVVILLGLAQKVRTQNRAAAVPIDFNRCVAGS